MKTVTSSSGKEIEVLRLQASMVDTVLRTISPRWASDLFGLGQTGPPAARITTRRLPYHAGRLIARSTDLWKHTIKNITASAGSLDGNFLTSLRKQLRRMIGARR